MGEADLDTLIAQEPVTSFGYGDGPLPRVTLCHSLERSVILLSAHHVATDGKTNVRIVEDLTAAVSGEDLGDPFPLLPGLGDFFGLGKPQPYVELSPAKAPPSRFQLNLPWPRVSVTFSMQMTCRFFGPLHQRRERRYKALSLQLSFLPEDALRSDGALPRCCAFPQLTYDLC